MELTPAKKKILDASLELFSRYGYEATSIGQIADAVGIKKPSLYSHFSGKWEIFDTLLAELNEYYDENSIFGKGEGDDKERFSRYLTMTPRDASRIVRKQMEFLLHDPVMKKVRKLLTIEQFRNPELAELMDKRTYADIVDYNERLIAFLVENGVFEECDTRLASLEYTSPISMLIYRVDRFPEKEAEALELVEKHIESFCEAHKKR